MRQYDTNIKAISEIEAKIYFAEKTLFVYK